jgi:hypothetical protein
MSSGRRGPSPILPHLTSFPSSTARFAVRPRQTALKLASFCPEQEEGQSDDGLWIFSGDGSHSSVDCLFLFHR